MLDVELVLIAPLIAAVLCHICPREKAISWITIIFSIIGFALTFNLALPVFLDGTVVSYGLWYVDGLSALFLMITSTVALMVSLYSYGYMGFERAEGILTMKSEMHCCTLLNLFVAIMLSVFVVSSVGIIWILIEATTLISTFLVGFYRQEKATEAAWKYLMVCSVGITLALIGISLVYASAVDVVTEGSSGLDWPVLMAVASQLDPTLLKTAMVFVIIGFGTKAGFAPMHTWLPDAHSEAPTPVSALLSATLLNCAFYSILRFYVISEIAIPGFASGLLLFFGMFSLIVAASFILNSKDLKRMLAYSSIEHMGLIAVGFGIGTTSSISAALFLVMAHSLTKPILFFSAGNILQGYGTKDMGIIRGLRERMPFTSFMLIAGSLAIVGMPPFAVFMGEAKLLLSMVGSGFWWLSAPFVVLLTIISAGFLLHVFRMCGGTYEGTVNEPKGIVRCVPFVLLVCAVMIFGLFMPDAMATGFDSIITSVFGGSL